MNIHIRKIDFGSARNSGGPFFGPQTAIFTLPEVPGGSCIEVFDSFLKRKILEARVLPPNSIFYFHFYHIFFNFVVFRTYVTQFQ